MPYCEVPAEMASRTERVFSGTRMHSRMYAVLIMISTAGTRPSPSQRFTRRWLMTARRTAASCKRICFCSGGGNTAMIRLIVSTASRACRVEKTMCPVSAACRAVPLVSMSHIAALLKDVYTEATETGDAVRHIEFRGFFEFLLLPGGHHAEGHGEHVLGAHAGLIGQREQLSVNS